MRKRSKDGSIHVTDERINTATHLVASILSLLGASLLVARAAAEASVWHIVSFSIYGTGLVLLFLASTLHHGIHASKKSEEFFRTLDYLAIFPLIAGSYTPFCLVVIRGVFGWTVFAVIWIVAITGIALRASIRSLPKWITTTFYLTLGLVSLVLVPSLFGKIPETAFLLAAGGFFYVAGNIIFTIEKPNPVPGIFGFHEIWHLFVIAGAFLHFLIMYFFILPYPIHP